jgi:hypothetical protein
MLNLKSGELPTLNTANIKAIKLELFNHFLNHKINSNKTVLENIIISFNRDYKPETYFYQSNNKSRIIDDSLNDIRSVAHLIVWEATDKYLWGVSGKTNIQYKEKFDFCVFASEQVKFKLRTHLRLLNTNRLCGKLPDSDKVRNIYSKLPKLKLEKKSLSNDDYKIIAEENNINIDDVKIIDKFITSKTESGDQEIKNESGEEGGNRWSQLELENSDCLKSNKDLEEQTNQNLIIKKFHNIKNDYLKTIPVREKEILNNTKLNEFNSSKQLTLAELGKKFNISSERVRQIAEKSFADFKKVLIKNKKDLEII